MKYRIMSICATRGSGRQFQSWQRLSQRTIRQKQRLYPNQRILQRSGALRRSLTQTPIIGIEPLELSYSTNTHYAIFHELGTQNLPKRSIFERAAVAAVPILQTALTRYFNEKIRDNTS